MIEHSPSPRLDPKATFIRYICGQCGEPLRSMGRRWRHETALERADRLRREETIAERRRASTR